MDGVNRRRASKEDENNEQIKGETNAAFVTDAASDAVSDDQFTRQSRYHGAQSSQQVSAKDKVQTQVGDCSGSTTMDEPPAVQTANETHKSKWSRIYDPVYREKIFKTAFIYWTCLAMGWLHGQMGPTLPDFRLIADASLDIITWLFTGFSIGYLIGCFTFGAIERRISEEGAVGFCAALCAIATVLLPLIPNFIAMVILRAVIGFCIGGIDIGMYTVMFKIWRSEVKPILQMIHVVFALGSVISPLVAKPFLINVQEQDYEVTTNSQMNTTCTNSDQITTTDTRYAKHKSTNVQYAYLIAGIIMALAAVPFTLYCKQTCNRNNDGADSNQTMNHEDNTSKAANAPLAIKITLIGMVLMMSYLAAALFYLFPGLLTTFLMSQLQWTQQDSSTITTVFFAAYGLGNFINIFILLALTLTKLILIMYISGFVTLLCFMFSVLVNWTTFIWITVAFFGLSFSSFLPTLLAWTQIHVTPVRTRIASSILFSGTLSLILNSLLIGYLMDNRSPMWFVYISCGEAGLCLFLFSAAVFVLKTCVKKEEITNEVIVTHL